VQGAAAIETLQDGDKVLISEGCTHHRQCDDIGSVKIPRWLKNYTRKELQIELSSGTEFPEDLSSYKLIIHCGGCMLNEREMKYRLKMRRRPECTNYQLWNCHCIYAGNFKTECGSFPAHSGRAAGGVGRRKRTARKEEAGGKMEKLYGKQTRLAEENFRLGAER